MLGCFDGYHHRFHCLSSLMMTVVAAGMTVTKCALFNILSTASLNSSR